MNWPLPLPRHFEVGKGGGEGRGDLIDLLSDESDADGATASMQDDGVMESTSGHGASGAFGWSQLSQELMINTRGRSKKEGSQDCIATNTEVPSFLAGVLPPGKSVTHGQLIDHTDSWRSTSLAVGRNSPQACPVGFMQKLPTNHPAVTGSVVVPLPQVGGDVFQNTQGHFFVSDFSGGCHSLNSSGSGGYDDPIVVQEAITGRAVVVSASGAGSSQLVCNMGVPAMQVVPNITPTPLRQSLWPSTLQGTPNHER